MKQLEENLLISKIIIKMNYEKLIKKINANKVCVLITDSLRFLIQFRATDN